MIPTNEPLRVKFTKFSAFFLQMTQLMKSASRSPLALLNGRLTASEKVAVAVPSDVYLKSASFVKRPTKVTLLML